MYHSDFAEDYFEQQAGTSNVQSCEGTFFGSKQNIVIASGKQAIKIM
jgi:hypothetical protein